MAERHEHEDDVVARAVQRLPRELTPPSHVAASLSRSLSRRRSANAAWRIAIAASLVIAAFAAGRLTAPAAIAPALSGEAFALLLYGGPADGGDDRAAEYGAWARELARQGRSVSGERLSDEAYMAGRAVNDPLPLQGFFIVEARDAREALELARRHPHARDGTVVVRQINTP
jgi:hypothetical protein